MLRPLLLAIVGALLLFAILGLAHPPSAARAASDDDPGVAHPNSTKHAQIDVPPAVSSATASDLQPASLISRPGEDALKDGAEHAIQAFPGAAQALQRSLQASILLRI